MEYLLNAQKPKYPQYAVLSERLKSYKKWPKFSPLDPGKLADSGFVFTGVGDSVRCYHCGGGLRNWEEGEDPWVKHARWFPDCGHILKVKGKKYVEQVIQENSVVEETSQALQKTTSQKPKQLGNNPEHEVLSRREVTTYPPQDPVESVESDWIGRCYQCGGVLMIRGDYDNMWEEHARMHPNCGHILLRTLQKNVDQILHGNSQVEIFFEHEESSQEKDQASEDPMQSIAYQSCIEMGFDPQFVQPAVELLISRHEGMKPLTLECLRSRLRATHSEDEDEEGDEQTEQEDPGMLGQLVEENARLKEKNMCKICRKDLADIVFLPCGHKVSCPWCATVHSKCPKCDKDITKCCKVFFQ